MARKVGVVLRVQTMSRLRPGDAGDDRGGRRGDAAQPADEIERDAFGAEDAPRRPRDARHRLARADRRAVRPLDLEGDLGVHQREGEPDEIETGDHAGLTRDERRGDRQIGGRDGVAW